MGRTHFEKGVNDLETCFPEIAKEWDYDKNFPVLPNEVLPNAERLKPWWICSLGHSYQASLTNRTHNRSGCPYCAGKIAYPGFNDLQSKFPELADEWDFQKNGDLTPATITFGSKKKVWWICPRNHSYCAAVNSRTANGTTCPRCSDAKRTSLNEQAILYYISKVFDVESRCKISGWEVDIYLKDYAIAIEYDGIYFHNSEELKERENRKNLALDKAGITLIRVKETWGDMNDDDNIIYLNQTHKNRHLDDCIHRLIDKLNILTCNAFRVDVNFRRDRIKILQIYHDYEKVNNITVTHPKVASEWNYLKNGNLLPETYTSGSSEKVWWKCSSGHEWEATIASRMNGHGCPYCSGLRPVSGISDFATSFPDLLFDWDYDKNIGIDPLTCAKGSKIKVWWKCDKGHSYQASLLNRGIGNTGCPYCSNKKVLPGFNDLKSQFPDIAIEFDYELNGGTLPEDFVYGSFKSVWWKCSNCGKNWKSAVRHRTLDKKKCGCFK